MQNDEGADGCREEKQDSKREGAVPMTTIVGQLIERCWMGTWSMQGET